MPFTFRDHVEWFEDPSRYPLQLDLIVSWRTALAVLASVGALAVLYLLQTRLNDRHWPRLPFLPWMAIGAPTLLAVQAAIPLIYSGVQPVLLAPQLHMGRSPGGLVLGAAEVLIGFSFITGLGDRLASLGVLALVILGFFLFAPLDALAQLHWVGIAVVIFVIGRQATEAGRPRRGSRLWRLGLSPAQAVVWLRVLTGVAIVAPALSEKIWNPGIAEAFLQQHPGFNFPHAFLGMAWMSDERFILFAGIFEFVIGTLLISGVLTRVVIIAMWFPFNLTIPFLPPQELLWHLPFFGIMYFLLVHGADLAPDSDHVGSGSGRAPDSRFRVPELAPEQGFEP